MFWIVYVGTIRCSVKHLVREKLLRAWVLLRGMSTPYDMLAHTPLRKNTRTAHIHTPHTRALHTRAHRLTYRHAQHDIQTTAYLQQRLNQRKHSNASVGWQSETERS